MVGISAGWVRDDWEKVAAAYLFAISHIENAPTATAEEQNENPPAPHPRNSLARHLTGTILKQERKILFLSNKKAFFIRLKRNGKGRMRGREIQFVPFVNKYLTTRLFARLFTERETLTTITRSSQILLIFDSIRIGANFTCSSIAIRKKLGGVVR